MMSNREIQKGENLTDELIGKMIGKIVQFYYSTSTGFPLTAIFRVVSLFTSIKAQNIIIGDFIAGEAIKSYLLKHRITGYKILTVKDLPLCIGYRHESLLFDELLRGK